MVSAPTTEVMAMIVPTDEIEAAGQQRQHLAHGDDGEIGRLPRDVDEVLAGEELPRQQR